MNLGLPLHSIPKVKEKTFPDTGKAEVNIEKLANPDSRDETVTFKLMKKSASKKRDSLKIEQLEKEIEDCRRVEAYLEDEVDTQRVEARHLRQHLSAALDNVARLTKEHERQKDHLRRKSIELVQTKAELQKFSNITNELREKVVDQEEVIRSSRQSISNLQEAIQSQKQEKESSENKLEVENSNIQQIKDERSKLIEEAEVPQESSFSLLKDLEEAQKGLRKFYATVDNKQIKILALEESENSLKQHLDIAVQAKDALDTSSNNLVRVNNELAQLEAERGELEEVVQMLRGRNNLLRNYLEDAHNDLSSLHAEVDEKNRYIKKAKRKKNALKQRLDKLIARTEVKEEKLRSEPSRYYSKLAKKDELIAKLQKELAETKKKLHTDKSEENDLLDDELNDLMEDSFHWTEKAYEYQNRCEAVEKTFDQYTASSSTQHHDDQQASFLQAAVNRKKDSATTSPRSSKWRIGEILRRSSKLKNSESSSNDECMRQLEETNIELEKIMARLRSDLVKQKTLQREELYLSERIIRGLQSENEAYMVKNENLSKIFYDGDSDRGNQTFVRAI